MVVIDLFNLTFESVIILMLTDKPPQMCHDLFTKNMLGIMRHSMKIDLRQQPPTIYTYLVSQVHLATVRCNPFAEA